VPQARLQFANSKRFHQLAKQAFHVKIGNVCGSKVWCMQQTWMSSARPALFCYSVSDSQQISQFCTALQTRILYSNDVQLDKLHHFQKDLIFDVCTSSWSTFWCLSKNIFCCQGEQTEVSKCPRLPLYTVCILDVLTYCFDMLVRTRWRRRERYWRRIAFAMAQSSETLITTFPPVLTHVLCRKNFMWFGNFTRLGLQEESRGGV